VEYPKFDSIIDLIVHLKKSPYVAGIFEYGSRECPDMSPGGDYDIFVITDDSHRTSASGISFYIQDIPIDCGLRNLSDLGLTNPPTPFDVVLGQARIIHDRDGDLSAVQNQLRQRWKVNSEISPGEIHFNRFAYRHVLDKVKHRIVTDPEYASFMLHSNMLWLVETYMSHHGLSTGDYKTAWGHFRLNYPDWYALLVEFHSECGLKRKYEITETLSENVMQPYGGLWEKDEVFFHLRDESRPLSEEEKSHAISIVLS